MIEVLKEFHENLKCLLNPCEKKLIKTFDRFETSVLQPHMWYFLKKKFPNLYIVKEYKYNSKSKEALDLAILDKGNCCLTYGIEVKGLPLKGNPLKGNKGFVNHRDNIADIGKDFLKLAQLVYSEKNKGYFFISFAYECAFEASLGRGANTKTYNINADKIRNISIIGKLIKEIVAECCSKKEKEVGAEAEKLWENLDKNKSLANLIEELKELSKIISLVPTSDEGRNSFNAKKCLNEKFNHCKENISRKLDEYKKIFQAITIKPVALSPDIDLGDDIKIRNFLFVIEPNQSP